MEIESIVRIQTHLLLFWGGARQVRLAVRKNVGNVDCGIHDRTPLSGQAQRGQTKYQENPAYLQVKRGMPVNLMM
jgi:uncharacterized membrane protein